MLSRVADSIFWMSRYLERAENVARFVDVNLNLSLDLGENTPDQWEPLVMTTGDHKLFFQKHSTVTAESVVEFLAFDGEYPNSILSCLRSARENARTVREILEGGVWEEINKFYLTVRGHAVSGGRIESAQEFFQHVRLTNQMLTGMADSTMTHDEAWHFARLGRLLERADKTSRILDVKYFLLLPHVSDVGTPLDNVQWSALLKSASALEAYRKRHGRIVPDQVAEFLIFDLEFPRSMRFCVTKAQESLRAITGTPPATFRNSAEQHLGRLAAELDFSQIADIIRRGLHEFIDDFQRRSNQVGLAIHDTFFALRPTPS